MLVFGVGLLVLSLLLVLLFSGGVFFVMSEEFGIGEGAEQEAVWAGWDPRRHCPAVCLLFRESVRNCSTSLMKLRRDWPLVTDIDIYRWGGEIIPSSASAHCGAELSGK